MFGVSRKGNLIYLVREVRALPGYLEDDTVYEFTLTSVENGVIKLINTPEHPLIIVKKDAVTGEPIPDDLYDRDAYFKAYEAEYSEIISSGDLGDLDADARYYHFLLEHDDGIKEDKVEYFVFDNGYEAAILLTPIPGKDIQSQREEFQPYLKTLKLG